MVESGELGGNTGWGFILVAAMANLAFKAVVVAALWERELFGAVAVGFRLSALAGAALLFLA